MYVHATYLSPNKPSYCSDSVRIGFCAKFIGVRLNSARNNTLASGLLILNYTPPGWRSPEQNKARLGLPLFYPLFVLVLCICICTRPCSRWIIQFQVASMDCL